MNKKIKQITAYLYDDDWFPSIAELEKYIDKKMSKSLIFKIIANPRDHRIIKKKIKVRRVKW